MPVVEQLEAVDVEQEDSRPFSFPVTALDDCGETVVEYSPSGEAGKGVVIGQALKLAFVFALNRHIADMTMPNRAAVFLSFVCRGDMVPAIGAILALIAEPMVQMTQTFSRVLNSLNIELNIFRMDIFQVIVRIADRRAGLMGHQLDEWLADIRNRKKRLRMKGLIGKGRPEDSRTISPSIPRSALFEFPL